MMISRLALACAAFAVLTVSAAADPMLGVDGAPGTDGPSVDTTLDQLGPISTQIPNLDGTFSVGSTGGNGSGYADGGKGGDGGDITVSGTTNTTSTVLIASQGGRGGNSGADGGQGGNSGNGGAISYTEDAASVSGGLLIQSSSEQAGFGQTKNGNGGNGGDVHAVIAGTHYVDQYLLAQYDIVVASVANGGGGNGGHGIDPADTGGNGGDVTVVFSGAAKTMALQSHGGSVAANGGKGGDIELTMSGKIDEDITIFTRGGNGLNGRGQGGDVNVTLENGAEIGGTIKVTDAAVANLILAFQLATQADVDAARASRTGDASSGSITVDGKSYRWSGFNNLVDQLTSLVRQTTSPIAVTLDGGGSVGGGGGGGSTTDTATAPIGKLRCDSSAVRVFVRANGSLAANIRLADNKHYAIGTIAGGAFAPAPGSQWTLQQNGNALVVVDAGGGQLASCNLG